MSVTKVWPRWQGRGATTDEKEVRTLKRQWGVETNSDLDYEPTVIDAVVAFDPTANLYASHPAWRWAVCRSLTAAPFQGPKQWLVDASYSTAPFAAAGDGSGSANNPTAPSASQSNSTPADQRPATLAINGKQITEPFEFDAVAYEAGNLVPHVNTVGDPFDPPVDLFRTHDVITWKFFRTPDQLDWNTRGKWKDSVNQVAINLLGRTYPALTLRCTDYSVDTVWETGASGLNLFFALTVQAEEDPRTWKVKTLNTGRRKKITVLGVDLAVAIVDGNGQPVADPVPLTSAGLPVAPGGTYHHVERDGYVPRNWLGTAGSLTGPGGILA